MGPARPGLEAGRALAPVAGQELVEPAAVHPVGGGELGDRPPRPQVGLDEEPAQVHRSTPALRCLLCLDTAELSCVAYLLNSDTLTSTTTTTTTAATP